MPPGGLSGTPTDARVGLYDVATGKAVRTLTGAGGPVAFSPDGSRLATGWQRNTVTLWDCATGNRIPTVFKGHRYSIHAIAFSPDGRRLAAGDSGEYNVILWDVATGRETFHIPGRTGRTDVADYSLAFSPDGTRLYSGNQDDSITVWEAGKQR
jgi:WD40 repeat protein